MAYDRFVIVGAGQSGGQIAAALRLAGYAGEIALLGEEIHLPYQRPPLSKAYLAGEFDVAQVLLRPAEYYVKHAIALKLGARAAAIYRAEHCVTLTTGEVLPYTWLTLATGAHLRPLPIPRVGYP